MARVKPRRLSASGAAATVGPDLLPALSPKIRDPRHPNRRREAAGNPAGQGELPKLQAQTFQHAGVLRPGWPRHPGDAAVLLLPRRAMLPRRLQSGECPRGLGQGRGSPRKERVCAPAAPPAAPSARKGPAASSGRGCRGMPPAVRGPGAPQERALLGAAAPGGQSFPGLFGLCRAGLRPPGWKPRAGGCRVVRRHRGKSGESGGEGRQGPRGAPRCRVPMAQRGVVPRHGGCVSRWCTEPAHNKAFIPRGCLSPSSWN